MNNYFPGIEFLFLLWDAHAHVDVVACIYRENTCHLELLFESSLLLGEELMLGGLVFVAEDDIEGFGNKHQRHTDDG